MSTTSHATVQDRTDSTITSFLAEHPRMIGVLFMIALLLTQVGQGAAATHSSIAGP